MRRPLAIAAVVLRITVAKVIIEGVASDFDCKVFVMKTSTTFCFEER
jgi:hypothetical protein